MYRYLDKQERMKETAVRVLKIILMAVGIVAAAFVIITIGLFLIYGLLTGVATVQEQWGQKDEATAILTSLTDESPREFMSLNKDVWGNEERVTIKNNGEMVSVELRSAGPDGKFDTANDIVATVTRMKGE